MSSLTHIPVGEVVSPEPDSQYQEAVQRLQHHRAELTRNAEELERHFKQLPTRTIGENPYVWLAGGFLVGLWLAR